MEAKSIAHKFYKKLMNLPSFTTYITTNIEQDTLKNCTFYPENTQDIEKLSNGVYSLVTGDLAKIKKVF